MTTMHKIIGKVSLSEPDANRRTSLQTILPDSDKKVAAIILRQYRDQLDTSEIATVQAVIDFSPPPPRSRTAEDVERDIDAVEREECVIETNAGTDSAVEACEAIGTGDPQFANYSIFERVGDGRTRHVGCDESRAPGIKRVVHDPIAARRRALTALRDELRSLTSRK